MTALFLTLRAHIHETERDVLVLGLALDQHPSDEARAQAAATSRQQQQREVDSVKISPIHAAVAAFRIAQPGESDEEEVVVVSIVPPGTADARQVAQDVNLDISLTAATGEFKITSPSRRVALVALSPALARLAPTPLDRCQALLPDGARCPLAKCEARWCAPHLEHHVVLHDEELAERKPQHESARACEYMGRTTEQNTAAYNDLQASVALRVIITHSLYAGAVDPNHEAWERVTQNDRGNIQKQLEFHGCDGSGCAPISSFFGHFCALAAARESVPVADGARQSCLVVCPAAVRARLRPDGAAPATVAVLFAGPPATTALYGTLMAAAKRFGDLPVFVPRKKEVFRVLTDEEWEKMVEEDCAWRAAQAEKNKGRDWWTPSVREGEVPGFW